MTPKKLQLLAVSTDPTVSQVLHETDLEHWNLVLFDAPERIFSAPVTDMSFLVLDEAVTGSNYISLIKKVRKLVDQGKLAVALGDALIEHVTAALPL